VGHNNETKKKKMIACLLKNNYIGGLHKEKPFRCFIFFQNPMFFNLTNFYVEAINPNYKFMVYARKKGFRNYGFIRIAKIIR
jgi:hypothetical protein